MDFQRNSNLWIQLSLVNSFWRVDNSNKPLLLALIVRWLNKINIYVHVTVYLIKEMILNYRVTLNIKKVMVRDEGAVEWIGVLILEAK